MCKKKDRLVGFIVPPTCIERRERLMKLLQARVMRNVYYTLKSIYDITPCFALVNEWRRTALVRENAFFLV